MKPGRFFVICVVIVCALLASAAHAYRMPRYRMDDADWKRPAEEVLARYAARIDEIDEVASLYRLDNYRRCHNCRLTSEEREVYAEYQSLKAPYEFWQYVVNLKQDLMALADNRAAKDEADRLAKKIVQKLYDLSNEYRVAGSALINNLLINAKAKDKGFCYHYTDALMKMLERERWRHYRFHWGAAYDRTWLENNALVITATGKHFETGLVVDAWRKASRPFWTAVREDYYPWVELKGVDLSP
jgi:hypothetical protein